MEVDLAPLAAGVSHQMAQDESSAGLTPASARSTVERLPAAHSAAFLSRSGEEAPSLPSIEPGSDTPLDSHTPKSSTPAPEMKRERERRVMPVRLRRVSNLLAGSKLEDDLPGSSSKLEGYVLPATATIFLTTDETVDTVPYENPLLDQDGALSLFADPEMAKACRERQIIETPEFRARDDTELMGKTRSIRSQEDTSDAAYERRHRRHDNLEKKQRKLEKEGLVRDRAKVERRVKELRDADPRSLMWLLEAREKQRQGDAAPVPASDTSAVEGTAAQGKVEDAGALMAKLERVRAELLEEANELLKRYDALLPNVNENPVPGRGEKRRRVQGEEGSGADDSDHGRPAHTGRKSLVSLGKRPEKHDQGPVSKVKSASASAQVRRSVSASSPSTSGPDRANLPHSRYLHPPASPVTGAEKGKAIAKKGRSPSAGSSPKIRQHFKPEDGRVRAETTYANIHARTSGGRFAPKSALVPGAEGAAPTAPAAKRGPRKSKDGQAPTARGSARRKSMEAMKKAAAEPRKKLQKVKLIFNRRGNRAQEDGVKLEDEEDEEDNTVAGPSSAASVNAQPPALTLEEAQALFAQDMSDDEDADADADGEDDLGIKKSEDR